MIHLDEYNLDSHKTLTVIEYTDEADWLALRTDGIGGSDVAAVMGLSEYTSPLMLYKRKKGLEDNSIPDSVYIRKGKALEPFIRDTYVKPYMAERGYAVTHPDFMMVNGDFPWLRANVDGLAVPLTSAKHTDNIVIEIKWVSEYAETHWFGDDYCGIPPWYYAQVQHYMAVTETSKAVLCALFDKTWTPHFFEIPFDLKFVTRMLAESKAFYEECLKKNMPPRIMPSIDKVSFMNLISEPSFVTTPKQESEEMTELCAEMSYLKDVVKPMNDQIAKLQDQILELYALGFKPKKGFSVSVSKQTRTSINNTKLAEEYPDAYAACKTVSEYTRSSIRKK